jgi:hypothetical protein
MPFCPALPGLRFVRPGLALLAAVLMVLPARAATPAAPGGLTWTVMAASGATDTAIVPGVALHVAQGESPAPFVPAGPFEATWSGSVLAELRGQFRFRATVGGTLTLSINGTNVLEAATGTDALSAPVTLSKGSNAFRAVFRSPAAGDAFVRLGWAETGTNTSPIPTASFRPAASPALADATRRHLGRELFLEHRCVRCHAGGAPSGAAAVPELAMDSPSLEGIGARRRSGWLAKWVLDPKSVRPSARMPKVLSGPEAPAEAEAIAAFLASLQTGGEVTTWPAAYRTRQAGPQAGEEPPAPGGEAKPLYERLHCAGCHNPPGTAQPDPAKLSQQGIAEKFPPGRLAELLRAPEAHYAWTRMPNFHLTEAEAKELEDWLFAAAPKPQLKPVGNTPALIEKGRTLVQTRGCLNCHALKLENQFKPLPLARLQERPADGKGGCLGEQPPAHYGFTPDQRAALGAFVQSGLPSLSRHVPAEFAARQARQLNCTACHGELEGFPPLDLLGAKLKPEWMARFIGGQIPHKMRFDNHPAGLPWLESRMPAFPSRAAALATGLSAQAGFPPRSPAEPPVDPALAAAGHKLVGKDGGLSCVQCHAVGPMAAMDVFESEGINLAWSADRLQPEFYRRWLRAPLSVDPQTKMPTYFEDSRSPITDVLDGDGERQIHAIWHYLRQGDRMAKPRTGLE